MKRIARRSSWHWIVLLTLFVTLCDGDVFAQSGSYPSSLRKWFAETDSTLLFEIYRTNNPVVTGPLRVVHRTARPVIIGSGLGVAVGEWASRSPRWQVPLAMVAAQSTGYVLQYGLKELFERSRPYSVYPSIRSRSSSHPSIRDPYAMPSGHATLAFATATILSISYPEWYVVSASSIWAGSVAVSRPWLGVHYPSDIVAGALLGTAIGIGIHFLLPRVTPAGP